MFHFSNKYLYYSDINILIFSDGSKSVKGDHSGSIQERLEKSSIYYDLVDKEGQPSLEYEELRRRIRNNIQEMWWVWTYYSFIDREILEDDTI